MRIQTRGNSNNVWLSSDAGVIEGTMIMSAPTLDKILQAVNEKYGTSLEGWSQIPTAYEVGDTLPNWNAYEKIEMTTQKIAVKLPGGGNKGLMYGTLSNKVFNMLTGGDSGLIATESGKVLNYAGPSVAQSSFIIGILSDYNLEATEVVQTIVDYPIGAEIPQWEQYEQYK